MAELKTNILYYGDNLDILRKYIPDESVDLIYLDPPFNSKKDYNILFKETSGLESEAQIHAFTDTWHWTQSAQDTYQELIVKAPAKVAKLIDSLHSAIGQNDVMAYLVMMTIRLQEMHRVLKPTGNLYLHCDPSASHYLKIVMDQIFGPGNFRNEIVWRRTGAHGPLRKFGPIHDVVLFYSKSNSYFFNIVRKPYMKGHVNSRYSLDETGQLKFTSGGNVLTGAGATKGESGQPWKGFDPTAKKRHWAIPQFLAEQMPTDFNELGTLARLDALYEAGLIEIKEGTQWPTPVRYLSDDDGNPLQDIWAYQPYTEGSVAGTKDGIDQDVAWLGTTDPERLGYQTQKPLGLLERIINSSCPQDGVVLDPFCGCGTAVVAAQKLNRKWIGIDITHLAINLMRTRLKDSFGIDVEVIGEPVDLESARALAHQKDRYQFQWWALGKLGARLISDQKKGADKGIDGVINFIDSTDSKAKRVIIQVKSGHVGAPTIRELKDVSSKEAMGVLITLEEPTGPMIKEALDAGYYHSPIWNKDYNKIQIITIEELLTGKTVDMPPQAQTNITYAKAPKVVKKGKQLRL